MNDKVIRLLLAIGMSHEDIAESIANTIYFEGIESPEN